MTEIPEHLLKRAQEAKEKAAAKKAQSSGDDGGAAEDSSSGESAGDSRIPAHLLERSKAAKARKSGGGDHEQAGIMLPAEAAELRRQATGQPLGFMAA